MNTNPDHKEFGSSLRRDGKVFRMLDRQRFAIGEVQLKGAEWSLIAHFLEVRDFHIRDSMVNEFSAIFKQYLPKPMRTPIMIQQSFGLGSIATPEPAGHGVSKRLRTAVARHRFGSSASSAKSESKARSSPQAGALLTSHKLSHQLPLTKRNHFAPLQPESLKSEPNNRRPARKRAHE